MREINDPSPFHLPPWVPHVDCRFSGYGVNDGLNSYHHGVIKTKNTLI